MALRFEHAFTVKATPDKVWAYLTDPYRVAPALPGAAITEKTGEGTWNGTITVKVGPVSARYKGTVRFEALDPAARTATIVAKGQDLSGRGGADMKMESRLSEKTPGETEVAMVSEVNVTGIMAQFGRGLVQDVSNQMFQKFTEAARTELEKPEAQPSGAAVAALLAKDVVPTTAAFEGPAAAAGATPLVVAPTSSPAPVTAVAPPAVHPPPAAAPPIEVVSFGTKLLARALGRMMRTPAFWIVVAAIAGLIYWFSR